MRKFLNKIGYTNRILLIAIADIVVLLISYGLALLVRFELHMNSIPREFMIGYVGYCAISIVVMIITYTLSKLYRSIWSYAGSSEVIRTFVASLITAIISAAASLYFVGRMPVSFYAMGWLLLFMGTAAIRLSYRMLRRLNISINTEPVSNQKNVMIIGAGAAGMTLLNEYQTSRYISDTVRCFIDDNKNKWGRFLHGVPIAGGRDQITEAVEKYHIDKIVFAIPSANRQNRKEILDICKQTDCELKTVPGIFQLINGDVNVSSLKNVDIEDLLGREQIEVNLDEILGYIKDKVVLVTGGGGSIGSEICRQLASHGVGQLIILDIYENNAYEIQQELKNQYPELDLIVLIGSVRNTHRINDIMDKYRPDIVYHAAAHKHVPLMEDSPNEAVKNNVFGTYKTAMAAGRYGVERFVLISTDKAVNPTNIMGASKRMCEMIIQTMNHQYDTEYVAVRFGNVLGSNGSVIPLFKKQIASGGPVTVTHPDIIRYFMTIPEAVSLVLQAGAYAKGGEIFVLDMGEPVKIADLAKNLIRLSGLKLGEDIEIQYTGLRPGEKLFEELLMDEEGLQETANKLIHIGKPIELDEKLFLKQLHELRLAANKDSRDIRKLVQQIVPTYVINEDEAQDNTLDDELKEILEKVDQEKAEQEEAGQEEVAQKKAGQEEVIQKKAGQEKTGQKESEQEEATEVFEDFEDSIKSMLADIDEMTVHVADEE